MHIYSLCGICCFNKKLINETESWIWGNPYHDNNHVTESCINLNCRWYVYRYLTIVKLSNYLTTCSIKLLPIKKNHDHISWIGQCTLYTLYKNLLERKDHWCCGHQIGLIYFIQYFQLVFLWNAFGRPTGVFRGRFTWYLNGILEFFICMVMTWFAVLIFI